MANQPILIILAGGASSRMWPLREKSLLKFGTQPLLVGQLQRYNRLGLDEVVIVANPQNKADITALTASLTQDIKLDVVVQQEPKGMGDAMLQTQSILSDKLDNPIYITQVHDVVEDTLHESMLGTFKKNPDSTFLAGYEMEAYFPGGYLSLNDDGRIVGIVEKPGPENRPSNLVNIVAHIHESAGRLFEAIEYEYASNDPADDHYERAMDKLMKQITYRVVSYKGFWAALKYPWHVLEIMDYFLSQVEGQQVAKDAFIADGATLVGNVFIGSGARVFPGAAVIGPAYIGAGTIVGNNALVRHSMVLDHCEIGFTTEVARSYVGPNCSMHAARVLDSIFAEGVNFSAGCTTANLRIDRSEVPVYVKGQKIYTGRDKLGSIVGKGAFLSVDVMTMPGVKVGEAAQIGPGTHVHKDVEDKQRVYVKQELQVVENVD